METDALIGVQDMGAAGLTCSTCEMGARGGAGIEIDVQHVPQRETGMTPYEIMLSESQERMLLVVKRGREHEVEAIFEKWDLHAAHIGVVTDDGLMRVKDRGEVVAEIPNTALVDEAPVYDRPTSRPAYLDEVRQLDLAALRPAPPPDALLTLLSVADHRQQALGLSPVRPHGPHQHAGARGHGRRRRPDQGDAARAGDVDRRQWPLLLPGSAPRRDARGRRGGAQRGVRRRRADRRHQLPELRQSRKARRSCGSWSRRSKASPKPAGRSTCPITGGNVSLYNETDGNAIYPTPIIGVVGVIEDAACTLGRGRSASPAATSCCSGDPDDNLGGSEYLKTVHGLVAGEAPRLDLTRERALIEVLVEAAGAPPHRIGARLLRWRPGGHARRMRVRQRRHRPVGGRAGRAAGPRLRGRAWRRCSAKSAAGSSSRWRRTSVRRSNRWRLRQASADGHREDRRDADRDRRGRAAGHRLRAGRSGTVVVIDTRPVFRGRAA